MNPYERELDRNPANHTALSPVAFVERSAEVFGHLPAVVHGARRYDWAQLRERSARLAAALRALGVRRHTKQSLEWVSAGESLNGVTLSDIISGSCRDIEHVAIDARLRSCPDVSPVPYWMTSRRLFVVRNGGRVRR